MAGLMRTSLLRTAPVEAQQRGCIVATLPLHRSGPAAQRITCPSSLPPQFLERASKFRVQAVAATESPSAKCVTFFRMLFRAYGSIMLWIYLQLVCSCRKSDSKMAVSDIGLVGLAVMGQVRTSYAVMK
jgi:hypothetical protein